MLPPSHMLLLLSSLLVVAHLQAVGATAKSFCEEEGWQQVWSDEFEGAELDETVWTKDIGDNHDSKTRQAAATADSVWVKDGALIIRSNGVWNGTAWNNLTSGAVDSFGKISWKGPTRVCVRAKLPGGGMHGKGTGIWPAHWLMPDDASCWPCHGEIDIMEMINGDGTLYGTYHWCLNQTCHAAKTHKSWGGNISMPNDNWSTEWHEFAVQYGIDPQEGQEQQVLLEYALDGQVYHQVLNQGALVFPNVPYYAILNTAVGGPWADPPNNNKGWSEEEVQLLLQPLQHTQFPTYHYIDWIRVAQPHPQWKEKADTTAVRED